EAMACYDESIMINDKSAYVLFMKSKLLFDLEKYKESIQFCDKAIKADPEDSDVWFCKGNSLKKLGKNEEAEICFVRAKELEK
ncbi:MAG: tetratricopeptide repeat protein, partial [Nitrosopumilus sp.]|nr:tetratricopeptide repeat protein [Nitrosopumilus sp.]MBT4216097.1 tetratricopeptide repeat protein [Nitrosopumilus sp.]